MTEQNKIDLLVDFRSYHDGLDPWDCDEEAIDEFMGHGRDCDVVRWTPQEIIEKNWLMAIRENPAIVGA